MTCSRPLDHHQPGTRWSQGRVHRRHAKGRPRGYDAQAPCQGAAKGVRCTGLKAAGCWKPDRAAKHWRSGRSCWALAARWKLMRSGLPCILWRVRCWHVAAWGLTAPACSGHRGGRRGRWGSFRRPAASDRLHGSSVAWQQPCAAQSVTTLLPGHPGEVRVQCRPMNTAVAAVCEYCAVPTNT